MERGDVVVNIRLPENHFLRYGIVDFVCGDHVKVNNGHTVVNMKTEDLKVIKKCINQKDS